MRCRMRCGDIWRCGGPIKKYVPVDSIGIEGRTQEMTFDSQVPPYSVTYPISISPSDATKKDVRIESNNPSVISVDSVESGQVTFTIHSEGEARVRITSLANADISDEYGVTITAPSQQFSPNNGIFVDVDTEGTATGRKRRTKATAMGDRFTARVFMLNEDNPNYVLLEWTHGGATSMALMGLANDEHTQNMFADAIRNKLAREIETLWDDGQIANGFVKFTDDDWTEIQEYYATDLTPESVAALQAELMDDAIVREPEQNCFTSMFFGIDWDPAESVTTRGGQKICWYGTPDLDGIVDPVVYEVGDTSIANISNYIIHPAEGGYSEYYEGIIEGLQAGETTITFYSVNNPRETKLVIPVTILPPIAVESIGAPSTESIGATVGAESDYVTFYYSPENASTTLRDVIITSSDESIATIGSAMDNGAGQAGFKVVGVGVGECTVTYSLGSTSYTVNVSVAAAPSYYYINLHQDEFPGEVEVGQTTVCQAEVRRHDENDTLAASDYDDSIVQITFNKRAVNHGGWRSDWDINITGLQEGETTARIHSVNNPEVYEDLLITVSEPIPPIPVESIGAPSENSINLDSGNEQAVTFSYYPANAQDASNVISVTTSNENVANISDVNYSNGIGTILIHGVDEGSATVSYAFGQTTYTISVAVTAPQIIPLQSISSPGSASTAIGNEETINFTLSPSNATVDLGDFDVISMEEQSVGVTDVQLENGVLSVTVTGFTLMCGAPVNVDYLPSEGAIYASCYVDSYANVTISSDGELFQYGEPCDNPFEFGFCDEGASWSVTNGTLNVNGEEFTGGADATTWTMDGVEINDGDSGEIAGDVTFNIGAIPQPYNISFEINSSDIPEGYKLTALYGNPITTWPFVLSVQDGGTVEVLFDGTGVMCSLNGQTLAISGTDLYTLAHWEVNGEPITTSTLQKVQVSGDTTIELIWDTAPSSCPASIQAVWGNDATIEVGQTAAVITNFTTTAECENVDYSNIVAHVRASYNVPSDVATASIDFNENKVYVTGVKAGECTVMFTDGDRSWSNNVTVTSTPPAYATISSGSENVTLQVNGEVLKTLYYSPEDADTSNITLTSSDSSVASGQIRDIQAGLITLSIYPAGEGQSAITVSDGTNSYVYNVTVVGSEPESHTFTINVENAPEDVQFDNSEETLEDFPIILDIPSGGSFNGACNSHDGDGDLNVTIYDTPDGSSEGVVNELNIACDGYKPLFEAVGFDLEDMGNGSYNFIKDDNYQIVPDSDASLTISFTPIEEPE